MNREDLTLGIVSFPDDPDSSMATSQTSDTMRVVVEPHPYDIAAVASRSSHTEWNDDVFRLLRTCRKLLAKGADAILLSGASARSVVVALETELDMPVSDMRAVDAFRVDITQDGRAARSLPARIPVSGWGSSAESAQPQLSTLWRKSCVTHPLVLIKRTFGCSLTIIHRFPIALRICYITEMILRSRCSPPVCASKRAAQAQSHCPAIRRTDSWHASSPIWECRS
jgi:hypothetical protein